MRGSCSNAVLRFEFICTQCQCLLIMCFKFGNVLLYVVIKGFLFDLFLSTLVLVMRLSQFLISIEILYLKIFT